MGLTSPRAHPWPPLLAGLFLFTLANAGVELAGVGPLAVAVVGALVVGKLLGVTFLVLTASRLRIAPVNSQISASDVAMVASMASIGLTVALFVAGVAFKNDARLQVASRAHPRTRAPAHPRTRALAHPRTRAPALSRTSASALHAS